MILTWDLLGVDLGALGNRFRSLWGVDSGALEGGFQLIWEPQEVDCRFGSLWASIWEPRVVDFGESVGRFHLIWEFRGVDLRASVNRLGSLGESVGSLGQSIWEPWVVDFGASEVDFWGLHGPPSLPR